MTNFFFDLDGTITKKEVLPIIADELGLFKEIELLTDATMKGFIPFDSSFKLRVQILKSVPIKQIHDIMELIPLHEEIVRFIQQNNDKCFVVTNNLDVWVEPIYKKIGCKFFTSEALMSNGSLEGIKNIIRKSEVIDKSPAKKKVAIGDGMNDAEMLRKADIGIAFGGVHNVAAALLEVADISIYDERSLCSFLNQLL